MESKLILSLDLSLSCTGFAVGEVSHGQIKVLEVGHINNAKFSKKSHAYRLHRIASVLKELFRKYKFDAVVRERGFSMRATTTQTLFKVVGVSDLMGFSFGYDSIKEIPPKTVKKCVTGSGSASKEEVANALPVYVGDIKYAVDDESDAVAVLVAYCIQENLILDY